jgi:hypothetical protein
MQYHQNSETTLQIRGPTIATLRSCDIRLRFADVGATGGEI